VIVRLDSPHLLYSWLQIIIEEFRKFEDTPLCMYYILIECSYYPYGSLWIKIRAVVGFNEEKDMRDEESYFLPLIVTPSPSSVC
jgi:hypothetical protein